MRSNTDKNRKGSMVDGLDAGGVAQRLGLVEFMHEAPRGKVVLTRGTAITHEFPLHVHDSFAVGIVHAGSRVIRARGADTVVDAGSVFVIPPGEPHSCGALQATGHTYTILSLKPDLLRSLAPAGLVEGDRAIGFTELSFRDERLFHQIVKLWSDLDDGRASDHWPPRLKAILERLITKYARVDDDQGRSLPSYSAVLAARRFLESTTHANVSQKDIARFAGLSKFHLSRSFRRVVGISPHSYHLGIRIRKGQRLLGEGASIVTAALETGFVDQSHFTRCFKRLVGVSPGLYKLRTWSS